MQQACTNKNEKNKKNHTVEQGSTPPSIPYGEIVSHLNQATGKNFRPTTKTTQRHIRARWAEGFRLDDFKAVIDRKAATWGTDAKMMDFLRPETLFGPKFEAYLNENGRGPAKATRNPAYKEI